MNVQIFLTETHKHLEAKETENIVLSYIVFIATLLSAWIILQHGIEKAMTWVWIPFFLVMPMEFAVNIPGLPDPNFMQAAILPIVLVLLRERSQELRFGRMELLVIIYCVWRVYVDYLNRGYADAQNYAFYMLTALICPYILGRYLINREEMDITVSRMYIAVMVLMFPLFLFELIFWISPIWKIFNRFFPEASTWHLLRYGLARTGGTFTHPILACIMIVIAYRLHKWLYWTGFYNRPQAGIMNNINNMTRLIPITLKTKLGIILILMALMTISRGPWIGAFAGAALVAVGNFKNRWFWLKIYAIGIIFCGIIGFYALDVYTTPVAGQVLDEQVASMLYRKELMDRYMDYILERMWTGWGLTRYPTVHGMPSIDNAWLFMALQHGILAPAVFTVILIYAIISQLKSGLRSQTGQTPIGFTFSGIYLMCLISFTTVYMGGQTEPMIFLLLGWGESIKNRNEKKLIQNNINVKQSELAKPFRNILT